MFNSLLIIILSYSRIDLIYILKREKIEIVLKDLEGCTIIGCNTGTMICESSLFIKYVILDACF